MLHANGQLIFSICYKHHSLPFVPFVTVVYLHPPIRVLRAQQHGLMKQDTCFNELVSHENILWKQSFEEKLTRIRHSEDVCFNNVKISGYHRDEIIIDVMLVCFVKCRLKMKYFFPTLSLLTSFMFKWCFQHSFNLRRLITCGQSYKASTIIIYDSRVVNMSNLLVTTTLES